MPTTLHRIHTSADSNRSRRRRAESPSLWDVGIVRASTIVMIGFAVLFGLLAVFLAQAWLNSEAARLKSQEAQKPQVATQTIVVASKPLRYGNELTPQVLQEIPWTESALPAGAFAKIGDVLKGGKRVVLAAIEVN